MPKLGVDDLEEGMVLAEDVRSASGYLLVPKDVPLKAFHIRALNRAGVERFEVAEGAERLKKNISLHDVPPEHLKKMKQELEMHFGGVQHTQEIGEVLFNFCLERKARQQQGNDE